MTANVNVYSNVREYNTNLDVYGKAFEWVSVIIVRMDQEAYEFYTPAYIGSVYVTGLDVEIFSDGVT
jgi:hypothetical protein